MLNFGFKKSGNTLTLASLILKAMAAGNGVDTSGNSNSFTNVTGSWAAGTFAGKFPNSTSVKTAIGHVAGVADWAYGADDLPLATPVMQATIIAHDDGNFLFATDKGVAVFSVAQQKTNAINQVLREPWTPVTYNGETITYGGNTVYA